jgi:hypothetical protein
VLFYFKPTDGGLVEDIEGLKLPDVAAAREEAMGPGSRPYTVGTFRPGLVTRDCRRHGRERASGTFHAHFSEPARLMPLCTCI